MTYRTTSSFAFFLLLTAGACAVQNAGAGFDDPPYEGDDAGGKASTGGTLSTSGSSSVHPIPLGGTTSSSGGKGGTSSGGTGGKGGTSSGGKGGTSSGGSGGKASSGGKGGTSGGGGGSGGTSTGDGGAPTNNPVDGLALTFKPESTNDNYDFIGGELQIVNDKAQPLDYASLKIRYYFTNEVAGTKVVMNWANFGPTNNTMQTSCTGTLVKLPAAKPGADSYIELTCSASGSLSAGTQLKISWKAGDQGNGKFTQTGDWSFNDPDKIVVIDNNNIVWGVEP
jgi:hypothetical protein